MAKKASIKTRAKRIADTVPDTKKDRVIEMAINVLFLEEKLDETRELIGNTKAVIPYDNGGGQKGLRKNPIYDQYMSLLKSYCSALKQLEEMTGEEAGEDGGALADLRLRSSFKLTAS